MFVKNYVFNESILFTFPANGEIWVFNRSYTQYIPLSLYDLQSWMGSPSIFVYDCSNAGIIVNSFEQFAEQHERDYQAQVSKIIFYKVVHSCCFWFASANWEISLKNSFFALTGQPKRRPRKIS